MAIVLIIKIICGAIAAAIASSKGRSTVGWFFGGFFFDLIAILIVACLSNRTEEENFRRQMEQENRRLREKLDQERMKSEVFRQHVAGRLDSHDAQLGVDTRSLQSALTGPEPDSTPPQLQSPGLPDSFFGDDLLAEPASRSADSNASDQKWFFEENGASHGPVPEPELARLFQAGKLNGDTLVWSEPIGDWTAANRVQVLRPYLTS